MSDSQNEKWYWLVGGGPMQVPILKYLHENGYKIILTDGNADCPGKKIADLFYTLDIHDEQAHLQLIPQVQIEVKGKLAGVSCIATDSHKTVAALAKELGLPGISSQLSDLIGDKVQLRKILTKIDVHQPKFLSFTKSDDLDEIVTKIKSTFSTDYKIIVKPLGWSASRGIKILDNTSTLRAEIDKARQVSRTGGIVIEEVIVSDGKLASETSVETLVLNGKVNFLNMVDRIFGEDLIYFKDERVPKKLNLGVEFGHVNPSSRSKAEVDEVIKDLQTMVDHLREIGVYRNETFILKADILFSLKGPVIIEATPRTSGGWDSSFSSLMRGLRIQELAVEISLGNEIFVEDWSTKNREFVAVVSDATSDFIDCLGRTFYGGRNCNDANSAVSSALDSRDANQAL
ncbi:AccC Biotin carboxylase [Candidatus Nanopelagicaceae bacterium]